MGTAVGGGVVLTVERQAGPDKQEPGKKRRRRPRDNEEFASFVHRVIRAYSRRVAEGDITALLDMTSLERNFSAAVGDAVRGLRDTGYTWDNIATHLGVTRQTAWERWGKR